MDKTAIKYIILSFILGAILCYFIMPSKTIIKNVEVDNVKDKETIAELEKQISSLENTNKKLSKKTHTVIIENPDGSKRTDIKTESDLYESKTQEIKEQYEAKLKDAQREIAQLKEHNKTEINKKRLFFDLGPTVNLSDFKDIGGYGHAGYNFAGSLTLNGLVQSNFKQNHYIGAGIGGAL